MAYSDYRGEYSALERDPVAIPQFVKDGIVLLVGGLTVFNIAQFNEVQMAWIMSVAAFISIAVTMYGRRHVYPEVIVENEFLDAEAGMDVPGTSSVKAGVRVEHHPEYGEIEVVEE